MNVIERRELGERDGFDLVALKVADDDTDIDDFDCYEPADVKAWKDDDWSFVGVIVQASRDGIELGEASTWGTEDGHSPGFVHPEYRPAGFTDAFDTTLGGDDAVYDLPADAISEAKQALARLVAEERNVKRVNRQRWRGRRRVACW